MLDDLLEQHTLLAYSEPPPEFEKLQGIYFLFHAGTLVYVGQTTNFQSRIETHVRERNKEFDAVTFLPVEDWRDLTPLEDAYIVKFMPPLNRAKNRQRNRAKFREIFE